MLSSLATVKLPDGVVERTAAQNQDLQNQQSMTPSK